MMFTRRGVDRLMGGLYVFRLKALRDAGQARQGEPHGLDGPDHALFAEPLVTTEVFCGQRTYGDISKFDDGGCDAAAVFRCHVSPRPARVASMIIPVPILMPLDFR